jgi:hypothetical protein
LKAEDDDEEETELKTSPIVKPINRLFNIKKEYTIKIEPSNTFLSKQEYILLIELSIQINRHHHLILIVSIVLI